MSLPASAWDPAVPMVEVEDVRLVVASRLLARIERLELFSGDLLVVQGESGSGKTSLLRALVGVDPDARFHGGRVAVLGRDPRCPPDLMRDRSLEVFRRETFAIAPQMARSTFEPMRPLREQFGLRRVDRVALEKRFRALDGEIVAEDPSRILRSRPFAVSGGQAQRVALATALVRGRPVRLLDEPTVGLDGIRRRALLDELVSLHSLDGEGAVTGSPTSPDGVVGVTVLATHDRWLCDHLLERCRASVVHFDRERMRSGASQATRSPAAPPAVSDAPLVLRVRGLVVRAAPDGVATPALDLDLHRGRITALLGPSGLGKSTLARTLAGFLEPVSGSLEWGDGPSRIGPGGDVHLVPQDASASLPPDRTVRSVLDEVVAHGPDTRETDRSEIDGWIGELDLGPRHLDQRCQSLSGGEARRVAILRGLLSGARVLIVDEPSGGLDPERLWRAISFLQRIALVRGTAMLWITHDRSLAERSAHSWVPWSDE